jgi:hypothetical protein
LIEAFARKACYRLGMSWESHMRLIFGIIIGVLLTVGGAYLVDTASSAGAKPVVNWDVVTQKMNSLSVRVQEGWRKIAG